MTVIDTTEAPVLASRAFANLSAALREAAHLGSVQALLGWDQETYMPDKGVEARAEQNAVIAGLIHERMTSDALGDLISACEADDAVTSDPASHAARTIHEIRRTYDKKRTLPGSLVRAFAQTGARAQHAWKDARASDNFKAFEPHLKAMMDLSRQKAECYGVPAFASGPFAGKGELYDALLDDYEPGACAAEIDAVFKPLRSELSDLVKELSDSGNRPDDSVLGVRVPEAAQHAFGIEVITQLGFDMKAGRLDTTTHPFCSGFSDGDTRLTTRYREQHFTDALYGTMHECGHGLYEQGLPKNPAVFGLPVSESISLGIHESQSRMWENMVGRSPEFWQWALPVANKHFGGALKGVDAGTMYRAVNTSTPSLIRVEADESTYNLHVMIRFGIERALISGDLAVSDLPGEWNKAYKDLLGVDVPDNARGCLQDVHWSFGLVGYFPTYTLGNLYSAQFWETIRRDVPGVESGFANGEFAPLLGWTRDKIHRHGRLYRAGELCEMVTGRPLSPEPLLDYLRTKLRGVHGL